MVFAAYATVSDIEIAWVLISTFGFSYSLLNWRESHKDISALRKQGISNGRLLIARVTRFQDAVRTIIHSVFLTIGVLAMFLAETPADARLPWSTVAIGIAVRWGLIASAILLVMQSFVSRRVRRRLLQAELGNVPNDEALGSFR